MESHTGVSENGTGVSLQFEVITDLHPFFTKGGSVHCLSGQSDNVFTVHSSLVELNTNDILY